MGAVTRLRSALGWAVGRGDELPRRLVVLSTHLDDGVFSLGAGIAAATRAGASVRVVTVLAGDPSSMAPAGEWDAAAGFATEGAAARGRREEDRRACERIGAVPRWLPYPDHQYAERPGDAAIAAAVEAELAEADAVLVPGFPLMHEDHVWLAGLTGLLRTGARIGRYVEQPYAIWAGPPGSGRWTPVAADIRDRIVKARACRAYTTQLVTFRTRHPVYAISRFEASQGGELVEW